MGQCIGRQNAVIIHPPGRAEGVAPEGAVQAPANLPQHLPRNTLQNPPQNRLTNAPGQQRAAPEAIPLSTIAAIPPASPAPSPSRNRSHSIFALSMWHELSEGDTTEAVRRLRALQNAEQKTLNWSHLGLTTLPPWIGQLRQLDHLDISHNALTELPEQLGELVTLKWLDISNNQLTHLPNSVSGMIGLQRFLTHHNRLQDLPDGLNDLQALVELRVDHNKLTALADTLLTMPQLIEINASDNAISQLPAALIAVTAHNANTTNTLIWLQNNPIAAACVAQHEQQAAAPEYHGPHLCLHSELAQALAPPAAVDDADPLATRAPIKQIHLLLEAAADLADKLETDQHSIGLGTRQLSRKDCVLMALEIALTHQRKLVPAISHHLINDFPADMARFGLLGINVKRSQIADWAQRQNLPVQATVDPDAAHIERVIAELGSQNVHRAPVLRSGRRQLERIRQRVPIPQSIDQAATAIRAHLAATPGSDVALYGLNTIMARTTRIAEFNESPAGALALLWTHIDNTCDPVLKANLQASMRNKLVEITSGICSVGMIQRMIDIPTAIDWSLTAEISPEQLHAEMMQLAAEVSEEFETLYGDPTAQAIAATPYVRPAPLDLSDATVRRNVVRRPTDFAECAALLIKAAESGQDIVEFLSRIRQSRASSLHAKSTLEILLAERVNLPVGDLAAILENRGNTSEEHNVNGPNRPTFPMISLNDRFQIDALKLVEASAVNPQMPGGVGADHRHVRIPIVDRESGQTRSLMLTQLHLKFADRLLRAAEIERADALCQQHMQQGRDDEQAAVGHANESLVASIGSGLRPIIVVTYREIKRAIHAEIIGSEATLDAALDAALRQITSRHTAQRNAPAILTAEQIAEMKIPLRRELMRLQEAKRKEEEKEIASSAIKRDMFRLKARVQMVMLRGLPEELIEEETERIFPADMRL